MNAPSLRRRVTVVTLVGLAMLLTSAGTFVYLMMKAALYASLNETLAARAGIAASLAELEHDPIELAAQLTAVGVPARVQAPSGRFVVAEPESPRLGGSPPSQTIPPEPPLVSVTLPLPSGGSVEVQASRAGVDRTLTSLLVAELGGLTGAFLIAVIVLNRAYAVALQPVNDIAEAAHQLVAAHAPEAATDALEGTDLGRITSAIDELATALETALDRAETAESRSRRLLDDASHHLRTPVAALRTVVESLALCDDPVERERLMGLLLRETARAARVTGMLLRLARVDGGEPVKVEPVDVMELCTRLVNDTAVLVAPNVTLALNGMVPQLQNVDPEVVQEVLAQLLRNAVRHARERVEVAVYQRGDVLSIAVGDDGEGLAPERAESAFDRFVSWDGGETAGLGLALVRQLARAHGGDAVYTGDSFLVTLRTGMGRTPTTGEVVATPRER